MNAANMSAHIMCLTSGGGLPLFSRKKGEGEPLPFPVVASLNGVHMFAKCHKMMLQSTSSSDMTVVWHEVEESVILIAAAHGATEDLLQKLLSLVHSTMIFTVGAEEIKSPRNIERLKKDLRVCYPILDKLLNGLEGGADLLGLHEVILCPENQLLQGILDAFCECVGSSYGVLMIRGCVSVATSSWWSLAPVERQLLVLLLQCGNEHTVAHDVPVFLPVKSPHVAYRVVSCLLTSDVEVCVLCGPTPGLSEVERAAAQCWRSAIDLLRNTQQSFSFDSGVAGVLLVDLEMGKFMLNRTPGMKRMDMLRTFYQHTVSSSVSHALESYWCSEYHKCHSLRSGNNLLCVMYSATVPNVTMRILSKKILKMILSDKQLCCASNPFSYASLLLPLKKGQVGLLQQTIS
ncbi:protein fuzzy [Schistocerca piceifrons]|uniref:protein fuzzy n=1 Tax=Schistocerca piceifrons TaxID=274613 RepID=UPI001F5F6E33|nr:protein fuzzy [Schistocerca piceifrons]